MRQATFFESLHIRSRNIVEEMTKATKQKTDVARLDGYPYVRVLTFRDRPPTVVHQPIYKRPHGLRLRLVDLPVDDLAVVAKWFRHWKRDHSRLCRDSGSKWSQWHIVGLCRRIVTHHRGEGCIYRLLDLGHHPEADVHLHWRAACGHDSSFYFLVEGHIGAAETIDRLFWIADDEEFPRARPYAAPVVFSGLVCCQQHQDLSLQRIRVLKLIYKYMSKALLQICAYVSVISHEVARAKEQVKEIQIADPLFQSFV